MSTMKKREPMLAGIVKDPVLLAQWLDALVDMDAVRAQQCVVKAKKQKCTASLEPQKGLLSLVKRQVLSQVDPLGRPYGMLSCGVLLTQRQKKQMDQVRQSRAAVDKNALSVQGQTQSIWQPEHWFLSANHIGHIQGFGASLATTGDWVKDLDWDTKWQRLCHTEGQYQEAQLDACLNLLKASVEHWFEYDAQGVSGALYVHANAYLWNVLTGFEKMPLNPWCATARSGLMLWQTGPMHWSAYEDTHAHASIWALDPEYLQKVLSNGGAKAQNDCGDGVLHVLATLPVPQHVHSVVLECANACVTAGANIHMPSNGGQTPLHLAASTDNEALCVWLIQQGADVRQKDEQGACALDYAPDTLYRVLRSL